MLSEPWRSTQTLRQHFGRRRRSVGNDADDFPSGERRRRKKTPQNSKKKKQGRRKKKEKNNEPATASTSDPNTCESGGGKSADASIPGVLGVTYRAVYGCCYLLGLPVLFGLVLHRLLWLLLLLLLLLLSAFHR